MIIKKINAEKTFQIRHPILRKGLPLDSCKFENDDDENSIHLCAIENNKLENVSKEKAIDDLIIALLCLKRFSSVTLFSLRQYLDITYPFSCIIKHLHPWRIFPFFWCPRKIIDTCESFWVWHHNVNSTIIITKTRSTISRTIGIKWIFFCILTRRINKPQSCLFNIIFISIFSISSFIWICFFIKR